MDIGERRMEMAHKRIFHCENSSTLRHLSRQALIPLLLATLELHVFQMQAAASRVLGLAPIDEVTAAMVRYLQRLEHGPSPSLAHLVRTHQAFSVVVRQ